MSNIAKKVPIGRTLTTYDHYLSHGKSTSKKKRPVVVIDTNKRNELAVVPLSSRDGKHRTKLKKYQDGKSYFKHFLEIEDNEKKPIKLNQKFKANNASNDVSLRDVMRIREKIFKHSSPAAENRKKYDKFKQ